MARCTGEAATTGTCLPGAYALSYTVTDTDTSLSVNVTQRVRVEQVSVTSLDYAFVSPIRNDSAASLEFAANLTANSSVRATVIGNQLRAFGIGTPMPADADASTWTPSLDDEWAATLRLINMTILDIAVEPSEEASGNTTWLIHVKLNATLGSIEQVDVPDEASTSTDSTDARRLMLLRRSRTLLSHATSVPPHHAGRALQRLQDMLTLQAPQGYSGGSGGDAVFGEEDADYETRAFGSAPARKPHQQLLSARQHGRQHLSAAVGGFVSAVEGAMRSLSSLNVALLGDGGEAEASEADWGTVGDDDTGSAGFAGGLRRRLLQSTNSSASANSSTSSGICSSSSTLSAPSTTANASTSATGAIVSSSQPATTCTSASASSDSVLLGLISSTLASIVNASAAASSAEDAMMVVMNGLGGKFDNRDNQYMTAISGLTSLATDSYANETARAQVMVDLLDATLAAQAKNDAALTSLTSLLESGLRQTEATIASVQLTTTLIVQGMGLTGDAGSEYDEGAYYACLLDRTTKDGFKATFTLAKFNASARSNGTNSDASARRRLAAAGGSSAAASAASARVYGGYDLVDSQQLVYDLALTKDLNPPRYAGVLGRNKVLAGLLLHSTRKQTKDVPQAAANPMDTPVCSTTSYPNLVGVCVGTNTTLASTDLGGMGVDPVFNAKSTMYIDVLDPSDWYNTTDGSGEINSGGVPYGFFHEPIEGYPAGYPIMLDTWLSANRMEQAFNYLQEGGYLSAVMTQTLTAEMVTFDQAAAVFGYLRMTATWLDSGDIYAMFNVYALPAVEYGADPNTWVPRRMAPDLALLVLVATYCFITGSDVLFKIKAQAKLDFEEEYVSHTVTATGSAYSKKKARRMAMAQRWSYRDRLSLPWLLYEVALCGVMITAAVLYFMYGTHLVDGNVFKSKFAAYDADTFAPARYFMTTRTVPTDAGALSAVLSAANLTSTPAAGSEGRWRLPATLQGLAEAASMYDAVSRMAYTYVLINLLQGIAILMLIVHGIKYISFQRRLSLISHTLAMMLPDMIHFMFVFLTMVVMLCLLLVVAFGHRVDGASSVSSSLVNLLSWILLADGVGDAMFKEFVSPFVSKTSAEAFLAQVLKLLAPAMMQMVMLSFLVGILVDPYSALRLKAGDAPGVPADLRRMLRWLRQRAPGNRHIDKLMDLVLEKELDVISRIKTLAVAPMEVLRHIRRVGRRPSIDKEPTTTPTTAIQLDDDGEEEIDADDLGQALRAASVAAMSMRMEAQRHRSMTAAVTAAARRPMRQDSSGADGAEGSVSGSRQLQAEGSTVRPSHVRVNTSVTLGSGRRMSTQSFSGPQVVARVRFGGDAAAPPGSGSSRRGSWVGDESAPAPVDTSSRSFAGEVPGSPSKSFVARSKLVFQLPALSRPSAVLPLPPSAGLTDQEAAEEADEKLIAAVRDNLLMRMGHTMASHDHPSQHNHSRPSPPRVGSNKVQPVAAARAGGMLPLPPVPQQAADARASSDAGAQQQQQEQQQQQWSRASSGPVGGAGGGSVGGRVRRASASRLARATGGSADYSAFAADARGLRSLPAMAGVEEGEQEALEGSMPRRPPRLRASGSHDALPAAEEAAADGAGASAGGDTCDRPLATRMSVASVASAERESIFALEQQLASPPGALLVPRSGSAIIPRSALLSELPGGGSKGHMLGRVSLCSAMATSMIRVSLPADLLEGASGWPEDPARGLSPRSSFRRQPSQVPRQVNMALVSQDSIASTLPGQVEGDDVPVSPTARRPAQERRPSVHADTNALVISSRQASATTPAAAAAAADGVTEGPAPPARPSTAGLPYLGSLELLLGLMAQHLTTLAAQIARAGEEAQHMAAQLADMTVRKTAAGGVPQAPTAAAAAAAAAGAPRSAARISIGGAGSKQGREASGSGAAEAAAAAAAAAFDASPSPSRPGSNEVPSSSLYDSAYSSNVPTSGSSLKGQQQQQQQQQHAVGAAAAGGDSAPSSGAGGSSGSASPRGLTGKAGAAAQQQQQQQQVAWPALQPPQEQAPVSPRAQPALLEPIAAEDTGTSTTTAGAAVIAAAALAAAAAVNPTAQLEQEEEEGSEEAAPGSAGPGDSGARRWRDLRSALTMTIAQQERRLKNVFSLVLSDVQRRRTGEPEYTAHVPAYSSSGAAGGSTDPSARGQQAQAQQGGGKDGSSVHKRGWGARRKAASKAAAAASGAAPDRPRHLPPMSSEEAIKALQQARLNSAQAGEEAYGGGHVPLGLGSMLPLNVTMGRKRAGAAAAAVVAANALARVDPYKIGGDEGASGNV